QTRPAQTCFDRVKPVLYCSNHTRAAETGFDRLKPVLTR
ncbi:hypothetical protein CPC197_1353, partial [Chlamydia psittaci C1/97]